MIREINEQEFINEVMSSGHPSIVVFGTDTCSVCVKAKSTTLPKWQEEHPRFKFYWINVIKNPGAARKAMVVPPNVPQLLVMAGLEVYAALKFMPNEEQFLSMIAEIDNIPKTGPKLFKKVVLFSNAVFRALKERKLFVSATVKQARMAKCSECVYMVKNNETCSECGCFVNIKTSLKTEKCPRGFWSEEK